MTADCPAATPATSTAATRMMPKRIQRRRTKGWRMPDGAVYVGRGSRWGNPYRWDKYPPLVWWDGESQRVSIAERRRWAVVDFKSSLAYGIGGLTNFPNLIEVRSELVGHDLVCWCPLDQPCHADVLLELANGAP